MKRILWNRRPVNESDGGDIDEIVFDGCMVHVEQQDDRCWWIGVYLGPEVDDPYWMGHLSCDSRGRMRFTEADNGGVDWDDDVSHEEQT